MALWLLLAMLISIRCWVKDVFELSYLCRVIDSNMSHRDAQLTARCYCIFYSAQLGSESSARVWSGLIHGGPKNLWLIKNGSAFGVVLEIRRLIPELSVSSISLWLFCHCAVFHSLFFLHFFVAPSHIHPSFTAVLRSLTEFRPCGINELLVV